MAATDASGATRGVLGLVGSKLLQVLVFPLIDKFVGKIAQNYAEKWEEHNRPYQVRTFTPANYTQPADSLSAADWARAMRPDWRPRYACGATTWTRPSTHTRPASVGP